MNTEIYNSKKALSNTGKEVSDTTSGSERSDVIDVRTKVPGSEEEAKKEGAGAEGNAETPEKLEEKRIAAQATMTPEEKEADNLKAAEAKLTPEEKEKAASDLKLKEEAQKKTTEEAESAVLAKVLKELGVTTLDELKKKIPGKQETEAEKTEREQNEKANLAQYAVKNKMLTMDEITSFENMKKADKKDLAFNAFSKLYEDIHKDRTDPDDSTKKVPVTKAEIEDAFNDTYHVNSENPALKKAGEELLDSYVKTLTGGVEGKYNEALEDFKEYQARSEFYPTFKTFYKEVMTNIPPEISWGEGDDKIVFKTENLDKAAIEKIFSTNEAYDAFYNKQGDQKVREQFKKAVDKEIIAQSIDKIVEVARQVGFDAGVKKGGVGAKVPFDENKQKQDAVNTQKAKMTPEEYRKQQAKHYANVNNR